MEIKTKKFTSDYDEVTQVIDYLKSRGITFKEIANKIERSDALLNKLKSGETKTNTGIYLNLIKDKFSDVLAAFYETAPDVSNAKLYGVLLELKQELSEIKNNIKK